MGLGVLWTIVLSGLSVLALPQQIPSWTPAKPAPGWTSSPPWGASLRGAMPWTDNPYRQHYKLSAILCHANTFPDYLEFTYDIPQGGKFVQYHGAQGKFSMNWVADIDHEHGERLIAVEPYTCAYGKERGRICFISFTIARRTPYGWGNARTYECGYQNPGNDRVERRDLHNSTSVTQTDDTRSTVAAIENEATGLGGNEGTFRDTPIGHGAMEVPATGPHEASGVPIHTNPDGTVQQGPYVYHGPVIAHSSAGSYGEPRFNSKHESDCRCGYGSYGPGLGYGWGGGATWYRWGYLQKYAMQRRRSFGPNLIPAEFWTQDMSNKPTAIIYFDGASSDVRYGTKDKGWHGIDVLQMWWHQDP